MLAVPHPIGRHPYGVSLRRIRPRRDPPRQGGGRGDPVADQPTVGV